MKHNSGELDTSQVLKQWRGQQLAMCVGVFGEFWGIARGENKETVEFYGWKRRREGRVKTLAKRIYIQQSGAWISNILQMTKL